MAWDSIKDLAEASIMQKGLSTRVQESMVLEQANSMLADFFGVAAGEKARAVYFKQGILTIAVLSNNLFHEIETQSTEFIHILNDKLGEDIVAELRFLS